MNSLWLELVLILALLLVNGVFAMAEIALVSSRKAKLQNLLDEGERRAGRVLELAKSPGRFLSTVQVGITLVGTCAAAVGGAALSERMEPLLQPYVGDYSEKVSVGIVVIAITFLSVVLGELVPKRLGLNAPEQISMTLAGPMARLAFWSTPIVWLLDKSSDLLLKLLGVRKVEEVPVSEEEVRVMIDQGAIAGVFKKAEARMVEGVLDLDETTVGDLMTPRARIIWLGADDKDEDNWRKIAGSGHSHFPVFAKTRDNVLGMVSVKSLWANVSLAGKVDLRAVVTPPLYVPSNMPAAKLFEEFKRAGKHIALVVDEFGVVQGLVSLHDLLEAIVGHMPEKEQTRDPQARRREDGSWLMDAMLETEPARAALGITDCLPGEEEGAFRTIGGFVLRLLAHIPKEGEKATWNGYSFEVVDMDRQRIDKLLVHPPKPPVGDMAAIIPPKISSVLPSPEDAPITRNRD